MFTGHLTTGSKQPPTIDGKLRLYSMEYCPFAQTVRLVLKAKNIPHDIVNIDLFNKPEWYTKIQPEGTVPALDTGNDVLVESLVISDYLDDKYPNRPLYPSDPAIKAKDIELIKKVGPLSSRQLHCIVKPNDKSIEDWKKVFVSQLQVFEDELTKRGTPFFGGDKPGMVDFVLWPWGERYEMVTLRLGQRLPFDSNELPLIRRWRKLMKDLPICQEMYHQPEVLWKVAEMKIKHMNNKL